MKEELTDCISDEVLEKIANDKDQCRGDLRVLARELLDERAKPKVWDGAPENATKAAVIFDYARMATTRYTRTLHKTRAREIAEEMFNATENIWACETAILKREAELKEAME